MGIKNDYQLPNPKNIIVVKITEFSLKIIKVSVN